jgi:hypothetical protein
MEPTMWMGKLEEILTGCSFDEILAEPTGKMVASRDGGERIVLSLTAQVQEALLEPDDGRIVEVGSAWAQPDEYYGTGTDPLVATDALRGLIDLLRVGQSNGGQAFCWVCV